MCEVLQGFLSESDFKASIQAYKSFTHEECPVRLKSDLFNGGSIIANEKLFDQWRVIDQFSSDGQTVNTANIDVTPLNYGGLNPGPGMQFDISNGEFNVTGDAIYAYLDFMFGFRVTVLYPGLWIKDNTLYLDTVNLDNSTTDVGM